jgi:Zn-dependent M28 family amino/carboxypeptidase
MGIRFVSFLFMLLLFLLFLLVQDERYSAMMDRISIENLKEHVRSIHFDRNPYDRHPELEQVAQYIQGELSRIGLEVKEDSFQWEGKTYKNILAVKRGEASPGRVVILGAHYDTVPGSPGADDNASAIAVLLEVARNIQKISLGSTLKLIAFGLEEYGYVGSLHYAERARRGGEKIHGMISLEMVGFTGPRQDYPPYMDPKYYPAVGDFIGIVGNENSKALLEVVRRTFKTQIPQLPSEFLLVPGDGVGMEEMRLSDHSPFWDRGFPALLVTDTAFLRNPNYHLPTDTMETLDFEFMRKVAVGIYYSIVELAK